MSRRADFKLPPVAVPGPELSQESILAIAKKPGGQRFLKARRVEIQKIREEYIAHSQAQLEQFDALLRSLNLAIDGGIEA